VESSLCTAAPYIQNRKSIPTYEINTLTYALCFWQFVIQVKIVACIGRFVSEFTWGNIFAVGLLVKYFATAHLFIININSVFEKIIRWSDGDRISAEWKGRAWKALASHQLDSRKVTWYSGGSHTRSNTLSITRYHSRTFRWGFKSENKTLSTTKRKLLLNFLNLLFVILFIKHRLWVPKTALVSITQIILQQK